MERMQQAGGFSDSLIRSLALKRDQRKQRGDALKPGEVLGEWTLLEVLAEGGMGQVYKARRDGEVGALKVIDARLSQDREFDRRFKKELHTLILLGQKPHPNLVNLLDHDRDLKHGDIKPANVLVRPDGTPVLVDFGLAKAVSGQGGTQAFGLTKVFCAREQQDVGLVSRASDVCSLAKTLFYALLHRDVERRILFMPKHAPAGLRELFESCLSPDPSERLGAAQAPPPARRRADAGEVSRGGPGCAPAGEGAGDTTHAGSRAADAQGRRRPHAAHPGVQHTSAAERRAPV
jgi:serine/threonine protein kinase